MSMIPRTTTDVDYTTVQYSTVYCVVVPCCKRSNNSGVKIAVMGSEDSSARNLAAFLDLAPQTRTKRSEMVPVRQWQDKEQLTSRLQRRKARSLRTPSFFRIGPTNPGEPNCFSSCCCNRSQEPSRRSNYDSLAFRSHVLRQTPRLRNRGRRHALIGACSQLDVTSLTLTECA